jgi:DNA segregation ATPase FtsK/SpoIIIE-like protein
MANMLQPPPVEGRDFQGGDASKRSRYKYPLSSSLYSLTFRQEIIMAIEEEALTSDGSSGGSNFGADEHEDELLEKALDYIRATKYASTSMLQRKFRIGYTRAARMMDLFEERGYVGPGQGSKPREVIFAPSSSVIGKQPEQYAHSAEDNEMPED